MKNFGPVLREARTNKGLTQADIAKHLNFDHTYISKAEGGVSVDTIDKIAKAYKEYAELHSRNVLLGLYDEGPFVTVEFLLSIPGELREETRGGAYPFEASKVYDGVRFFAISKNSLLDEAEAEMVLREEAERLRAETLEVLG
jgi:transcriptional regulator with XRE-family HTH domain